MNDYGTDNNSFINEEQIRRENIEREAERSSRQDNMPSQEVSLRIGSGEGGDLWYSKAYQAKLEGEVSAVTDILNEIAGPEVFEDIKTKVDAGMTRSEAVRDSANEYLERLYSDQVDMDKAADAVVDAITENGIELEDVAAAGIEAFKGLVEEISENSVPDTETDDAIAQKLDDLESAVEKLGDKIEQVHSEADAMNDKRDNLAKVDDLSYRNTFRQWAVLSVKIQARANGIEINGSVPRATEILVDISNQFRSNIIESIIELAFSKIEDAVERRYDDVSKPETAQETENDIPDTNTDIPEPGYDDAPIETPEKQSVEQILSQPDSDVPDKPHEDVSDETLLEGLERINDNTEYSFSDFVSEHKYELAEKDGDERLIGAYCDLVIEKGAENISADLTYSLAYYDKDGFCKGLDNIEAALTERGLSAGKCNMLIDNAIESYCNDPIVSVTQGVESIEFDLPVSRDTSFDIDGERYTVGKNENVHYDIYMSEGSVISNMVSVSNGDFYVPVESRPDDVIPFVCDVLADIYGKDIGIMIKDVAAMLENKFPSDKGFIVEKICDHIGDFIDARKSEKWELYDIETNIADVISAERESYDDIDDKKNDVDNNGDGDGFNDDDSPIDFTDIEEDD
ncbi:MAG: hypothetical protein IK990_20985 [Ruminiclostridium sp.]|nr:hypothetical protein [Ruminiclostridium sp.]